MIPLTRTNPDRRPPTARTRRLDWRFDWRLDWRFDWRGWNLIGLSALTAYSTALGWQAQLVSYPLLGAVSAEDFAAYHHQYNAAIPVVVIVPGFATFLGAVAFYWTRPPSVPRPAATLVATTGLVSLLTTVLWAIPMHDRLDRDGPSTATIESLLDANLLRSLALTAGVLTLAWCTGARHTAREHAAAPDADLPTRHQHQHQHRHTTSEVAVSAPRTAGYAEPPGRPAVPQAADPSVDVHEEVRGEVRGEVSIELNQLLDRAVHRILAEGTRAQWRTLVAMATAAQELSPGASAALIDSTGSEIARLRAFGIVHAVLIRDLSTSQQAHLLTQIGDCFVDEPAAGSQTVIEDAISRSQPRRTSSGPRARAAHLLWSDPPQ